MSLASMGTRAQHFFTDNSPALLTGVGVAGTVTTAVLTGRATFKAAEILAANRPMKYNSIVTSEGRIGQPDDPDLTAKDKVKLVYKEYLPAIGVGSLTVAAIIGANRIGTRRAATIAAAYSLSERAHAEYKDKVKNLLGDKKEQEVRDEIAKDRVARDRTIHSGSINVPPGQVLLHDAYSGRFFAGTIEGVRKAENDVNQLLYSDGYAAISQFYDRVGLAHTSISDTFGWNTDEPLVLVWSTVPGPEDHDPAAHSYDFGTEAKLRPWASGSFLGR